MHIKIYFGEAIILIHNEETTPSLSFDIENKFKEIIEPGKKALKILQDSFSTGMKENYSFKVRDVASFFKKFCTAYTPIEAAGGIVQNNNKEVLFIYRLGKWDLPKGKIEKGENPPIAAAREITEETGVSKLALTEPICKTYHIYNAFEKCYLKTTHWFHFVSTGKDKLTAQAEENITKVKWISTIDIKKPTANTYQNIKDVLSTYFDKP